MLPLTASNAYSVSSSVMSDSLDWARLLYPWNSSGKNTGVGCHSLMRKHTPLCLIFIDLPRLLLHQPLLLSAFDLCCCSVTKLCPTLCKPMGCSTPGFPVLHHLPEFAQTHVHWVSDTITPSHSLLSLLLLPSIFPSIKVFPNESALHIRWPKYWNFSISSSNEYSGLVYFRIDWFDFLVTLSYILPLYMLYHLPASTPVSCLSLSLARSHNSKTDSQNTENFSLITPITAVWLWEPFS